MAYTRRYNSNGKRVRATRKSANSKLLWTLGITLLVACGAIKAFVGRCTNNEPRVKLEVPSKTQKESGAATSTEGKSVSKTDIIEDRLEQPAKITSTKELLLYKPNYVVSYNTSTFCPNYVAWHLYPERCDGEVSRKASNFHGDEDIAEEYRVETFDYSNSGYDRGHMCPAADNKNSVEFMSASFCMTNICPQDRSLNAGQWNDVEQLCRDWAHKYGDVYIVCGPIFDSTSPATIGKTDRMQIAVPDRFFKCVVVLGDHPQGIAFVMANQPGNTPLSSYCVSIDEVEAITGYDFYPLLPDDVENEVEAQCAPQQWNL